MTALRQSWPDSEDGTWVLIMVGNENKSSRGNSFLSSQKHQEEHRKKQGTRLVLLILTSLTCMPTIHTLILLQLAVQALEEANRWTMTYHQRDLDQQRRNSDFHRKSELVIQTNRCTLGRRKIWIAIELKEKLKKKIKGMRMQKTETDI